MKTVLSKFSRGKYILRDEGWYALVKQGFSYFTSLFISSGTYFIYEFDLSRHQVSEIKRTANILSVPVTSIANFELLLSQGYDFGTREFCNKLNKGVVAFCIFVEKVLAAECWAATNANGKNAVDPLPFHVDFENGVACTGVRFTNPRFRRNGFSVYTHLARSSYLKEHGFTKAKASVNVTNTVSELTNEKYYGKKVSKGRYVRILGWHYWKEKSIA